MRVLFYAVLALFLFDSRPSEAFDFKPRDAARLFKTALVVYFDVDENQVDELITDERCRIIKALKGDREECKFTFSDSAKYEFISNPNEKVTLAASVFVAGNKTKKDDMYIVAQNGVKVFCPPDITRSELANIFSEMRQSINTQNTINKSAEKLVGDYKYMMFVTDRPETYTLMIAIRKSEKQ